MTGVYAQATPFVVVYVVGVVRSEYGRMVSYLAGGQRCVIGLEKFKGQMEAGELVRLDLDWFREIFGRDSA